MSKRALAILHFVLVFASLTVMLGAMFRLSVVLFVIAVALWVASSVVYKRMETGRWWGWDWEANFEWLTNIWKRLRAEWIARMDKAPRYWVGPAQNPDHSTYRVEYERLVQIFPRSRVDQLLLAEAIDGLQGYGDDPLAKPPAVRGFMGAVAGAGATRWLWAGIALLGAVSIGLFGWVRLEQANARLSCSAAELEGRSDRQPCLDLAAVQDALTQAQGRAIAAEAARAQNVGVQVAEARETASLNQRRAERERASRERRGRALNDDVESLRNARAPDWNGRLRDLAQPADGSGELTPGAGSGVGAASGVPTTGARAADIPDSSATGGSDAGN